MFAHEYLGLTKAVVSNPTWGNHITLFEHAGLKVDRYPYLNKEKNGVDFEAMKACLEGLEAGTVVLLHACCHNPTGYDLNAEQWAEVTRIIQERDLLPFLDIAYQGFGSGLDDDAAAVRALCAAGVSFMVSSSCSKNFGLYGERAGGLHIVTPNAGEAAVVTSIIKAIVRAEYSNPATHGAAIVNEVLNDEELYAVWEDEVTGMRTRIRSMRESLSPRARPSAPTSPSPSVRRACSRSQASTPNRCSHCVRSTASTAWPTAAFASPASTLKM